MRPQLTLLFAVIALTHGRAESVIEGRVALPKTRSAPVVAKRYEIVAKGGVLAPNPPIAVVWLEGNFSKAGDLPVRQMSQKDLAFVTPLLVVRTGTRVEFPNLDDTHHNIFSFSPIAPYHSGSSQVRYSAVGLLQVPFTARCSEHGLRGCRRRDIPGACVQRPGWSRPCFGSRRAGEALCSQW